MAVNLALLAALVVYDARSTGDGFIYPLDDTYIHMGLARNLVQHGTWGVNPGEFVSASSSPLWTCVLALGFLVFGPVHLLPLLLNALLSVAVVLLAERGLRRADMPRGAILPALLAVVVLTPVPFIAGLGMEHTLQIALALALVELFADATSCETGRGRLVLLALTAAAATLTRYELAFLVGWAAILLAAQRRFRAGLTLALAGALPLLAFGLWSVAQGGYPVPNSLLMKSAIAGSWWHNLQVNLVEGAPVWLLVAAAAIFALERTRPHPRLFLFATTATTHLCVARVGWLWRYEAWLVALGLVVLGPYAARALVGRIARRDWAAPALLLTVGALSLGIRAGEAARMFGPYGRRIYESNVKMATYFQRYWAGRTIAMNDIGAVSWFADSEIFDVGGIASNEVTELHLEAALQGAAISELYARHGVAIAWTDERWLVDDLPGPCDPVARYHVERPEGGRIGWILCAVDPTARDQLARTLAEYRAELPPGSELVFADEIEIALHGLQLEGDAIQHEPDRLAFYANGRARGLAPADGTLWVVASGSPAAGRGPRLAVDAGDAVGEFQVSAEPGSFEVGPVRAGQPFALRYEDDLVDEAGHDRNLFVRRVFVRP